MYGIIQDSIFEGTLRDRWQALVVFMAMIVLADADDNVDMTVAALAARTGLPLGVVAEGIEILESPDEFSRTPEDDGRRIRRLDDHRPWGWHVVNRGKYKRLRRSEDRRDYYRDYRRKKRAEARDEHLFTEPFTPVHTCSPQAVGSRKEKEEVDTENLEHMASGEAARGSSRAEKPEPEGFAEWYALYPRKVKRPLAARAYGVAVRREGPERSQKLLLCTRQWVEFWRDSSTEEIHIPYPASFLNGRQYADTPPEVPDATGL